MKTFKVSVFVSISGFRDYKTPISIFVSGYIMSMHANVCYTLSQSLRQSQIVFGSLILQHVVFAQCKSHKFTISHSESLCLLC